MRIIRELYNIKQHASYICIYILEPNVKYFGTTFKRTKIEYQNHRAFIYKTLELLLSNNLNLLRPIDATFT